MGRPYDNEITKLPGTYEWCRRVDLSDLASFLRSTSLMPMTFVGSGGSFGVAAFAAGLHELYAERVARPATPLDVASSPAARNSAILFISAGGRHPDILGAFKSVARMEPRRLAVMCGSKASPLAEIVGKTPGALYLPFHFPAGKDGYLATNSVLASAMLLLRGFWKAHSLMMTFPTFKALDSRGMVALFESVRERTAILWTQPNVLVLYGPTGMAAALDFESRFHEAGLAAVQLADYRNFAHGRHFWLARRKRSTAVLEFVTPDDLDLASRTLALLPDDIVLAQVTVNAPSPLATIELLLLSIHMAGWAGQARGVDPGRPAVPEFGRRIYHLNAWVRPMRKEQDCDVAIWRKSKCSRAVLRATSEGTEWVSAHADFVDDLASARFAAVVLDYDDTVCAPIERYTRPGMAMARELNRLLAAGLWLGIATGRGKSVRKALRSVIKSVFWRRVVVGYYNGALVSDLSDASTPAVAELPKDGPLGTFISMVAAERRLPALVKIESNAAQVKIEPAGGAELSAVTGWIQHLVARAQLPLRVVSSSGSVDVIPQQTSKNAVLAAIRQACGQSTEVLCIGDSGQWPGNDFDLLANPHSLSSDATSPDPSTGWNLAPLGVRCADATVGYLKALEFRNGKARYRLLASVKA